MTRVPARRSAGAVKRRAAAHPLAAAPSYDIRFGVILDINGSPVPITSGMLSEAKKKGVEFELQSPIDLGSLDEFREWVNEKFKVSLPASEDLPSPLDKVVGAITGMQITVEKAHVKVPGSESTEKTVLVLLEVNGTFQPEISLIDGKLGIQGMVFGFSNWPASES